MNYAPQVHLHESRRQNKVYGKIEINKLVGAIEDVLVQIVLTAGVHLQKYI